MTVQLDDARWRAAVDAAAVDEASAEQLALLERYQPQGTEYRAEHALLAALRDPSELVDPSSPAEDDDALLGAVMARFEGRDDLTMQPAPAPRRMAPLALAATAGAVLAAGLAAVWIGTHPGSGLGADPASALAPALADLSGHLDGSGSPTSPRWRVASGSATVATNATTSSAALPIDVPLRVEDALCTERSGASICMRTGTRFVARASGGITVLEGYAEVRTQEVARPPIDLDEVRVEADADSVVVLERRSAAWSIRVDRGQATVVESQTRRVVRAGETLAHGRSDDDAVPSEDTDAGLAEPLEASTPASRPSARSTTAGPKASALLRRAREQRRAGDLDAALATYQRLRTSHPRSSAARAASVSIGQLHLERGRPASALQAFRRYLRRGGPLAEDAAFGEIRALRALGRTAPAKRAEAAFAQRYPKSRYGAKLGR